MPCSKANSLVFIAEKFLTYFALRHEHVDFFSLLVLGENCFSIFAKAIFNAHRWVKTFFACNGFTCTYLRVISFKPCALMNLSTFFISLLAHSSIVCSSLIVDQNNLPYSYVRHDPMWFPDIHCLKYFTRSITKETSTNRRASRSLLWILLRMWDYKSNKSSKAT